MTEVVVFIDAHTLECTVEPGQTCTLCHTMLRKSLFYHRAKQCKRCYNRYWMEKQDMAAKLPHEMHIDKAVYRANRRSRYRKSNGGVLTYTEALQKWTGRCSCCNYTIHFGWHPRKSNDSVAIIDRVDTQHNASYANNMQWMCHACNTEKGGWDLAKQLGQEVEALKKKLRHRKKKQKREMLYTDILIPSGKRSTPRSWSQIPENECS